MKNICVFDIGNTLINIYGVEKSELFRLFTYKVLDKEKVTIEKYKLAAIVTEIYYQKNYEILLNDNETFWRNYYIIGLMTIGFTLTEAEILTEKIMRESTPLIRYSLIEGAIELLTRLYNKDYVLIAMSNWDGTLEDTLKKMRIRNLFFRIYDSKVVGLEKPDLDFFHMVRNDIAKNADNIYFIGDTIFTDIIPAERVGFIPILFDSIDALSGVYNGFRISRLDQAWGIIKK